jgi:hypothetical protein
MTDTWDLNWWTQTWTPEEIDAAHDEALAEDARPTLTEFEGRICRLCSRLVAEDGLPITTDIPVPSRHQGFDSSRIRLTRVLCSECRPNCLHRSHYTVAQPVGRAKAFCNGCGVEVEW